MKKAVKSVPPRDTSQKKEEMVKKTVKKVFDLSLLFCVKSSTDCSSAASLPVESDECVSE